MFGLSDAVSSARALAENADQGVAAYAHRAVAGAAAAAATAGGGAAAAVTSPVAGMAAWANPAAPQKETELMVLAWDLLHEISRDDEEIDASAVHYKINQLILALRLGKKDQIASDLETQQVTFRSRDNAINHSTAAINNSAADGKADFLRGLHNYRNCIEAIHDLCITIMEEELPQAVKSYLSRITETLEKSQINRNIQSIKRIYSGSIFDLPVQPGFDLPIQDGSVGACKTLKEYCLIARRESSYILRIPKEMFNRQTILRAIIDYADLSQLDKDTLIFSILFLSEDSTPPEQLNEKNKRILTLINAALEKGANFSQSHRFPKELIGYFAKMMFSGNFDQSYEKMFFHDFDVRTKETGRPSFLQIIEGEVNDRGYLVNWLRQGDAYKIAIDHGADPRDILSQEKIDKIQAAIDQGVHAYNQEVSFGGVSRAIQKKAYIIPNGVEEWEFLLFFAWRDQIYRKAIENVRKKQRPAAGISNGNDSAAGVVAAKLGVALVESSAAGGGTKVSKGLAAASTEKMNPLMQAIKDATTFKRGEEWIDLPSEVVSLIGGVDGYCCGLPLEVVREVQSIRAATPGIRVISESDAISKGIIKPKAAAAASGAAAAVGRS